MAALIEVEGSLAGFPSRVPYRSVVIDIEITSAIVHRYVIIAVTGDAAELGILVERIATCCVRDE